MMKRMLGLLAVLFSVLVAGRSHSAMYCVGTPSQLDAVLSVATANGESDTIRLRQGIYTGTFVFDSSEDAGITIVGGFDATCASRTADPGTTIIDGGGSGTPLLIRIIGEGDVQLDGLTIQNGGYRGLYIKLDNDPAGTIGSIDIENCVIADNATKGGIYILAADSPAFVPGGIRLAHNVIRGNVSNEGGAGVSILSQWDARPSDVVLANNVIVGNLGSSSSGGVYISAGLQTRVFLVNNTIADNHAYTALVNAGGVRIDNDGMAQLYVYNNIIWGNESQSGVADLWFNDGGMVHIGRNNDYAELSGAWTIASDNRDVDPSFQSPGYWNDNGTPASWTDDAWIDGDYHLSEGSPCIDTGNVDAPDLPALDIDGGPRSVDGNGDGNAEPDIGADEVARDCLADTEPDGDVDGADLAAVAAGMALIDSGVIAGEFGSNDCR